MIIFEALVTASFKSLVTLTFSGKFSLARYFLFFLFSCRELADSWDRDHSITSGECFAKAIARADPNDPEPRIHIPIVTNFGARMCVDDVVHHMPADGSVWVTDNTKYHNAFNGGEEDRVHLVATVLNFQMSTFGYGFPKNI